MQVVMSTKQQASPFDCSHCLLCLPSCSLRCCSTGTRRRSAGVCCCCMIFTVNYMMSAAAGGREAKVQWHCGGAEEDQGAECSHGEPGLRRDTQARLLQALLQLCIQNAAWQQNVIFA